MQNTERASRLYRVSTAWLVLGTWPLYLLAALFAGPILEVVGSGYRRGEIAVVALALTMLVATACGMVDVVLTMAGRSTWSLANQLLALTVMCGLDFYLVPAHGVTGAAFGWAAAILVKNLVPLAQVGLTLGLNPMGRATLSAMTATLLCFGAVPLAGRAVGGPVAGILSIMVGALLFATLIILWRRRLEIDSLQVFAKVRGSSTASVEATLREGEE